MTRNEGGVWEIFTDLPKEGDITSTISNGSSGQEILKIDPLAYFEERPGTELLFGLSPDEEVARWDFGLAGERCWGFSQDRSISSVC